MYIHIFIILYVHTHYNIITVLYTQILNIKIFIHLLVQIEQEDTKPCMINFTTTGYKRHMILFYYYLSISSHHNIVLHKEMYPYILYV